MATITLGMNQWRRREWISFAAILLSLGVLLMAAGFPIIMWDSPRYINAAFFLQSSPWSLTTVAYLLHPLVSFFGMWGIAIFHIFILSYVVVAALKFFNRGMMSGLLAILLSFAAYFAVQIMMDIYTAVGLLALFLILHKENDILLKIILGICLIAHYENLVLFPLIFFLYLIVSQERRFLKYGSVIICFMAAVFLTILVNGLSGKTMSYSMGQIYPSVAVRMMVDLPKTAHSFMEERPGSIFSQNREFYESTEGAKDRFHLLMWDLKGGYMFQKSFSQREVNHEAKEFVGYVLKNDNLKLLQSSLKNTGRFLFFAGDKIGEENAASPIEQFIVNQMAQQEVEQAKHSLQYRGQLEKINFRLFYSLIYYAALLSMALFILTEKVKDKAIRNLIVFSFLIIFVNALIMPNVVGQYLRYQFRILLIPCFCMVLIIGQQIKLLRQHPAFKK